MKTRMNHLVTLLLMVAVLLGFTTCANDDPHTLERAEAQAVAVALDNSQCPDVVIGQTHLFAYDTGGNLCATHHYVDAYDVASVLLPLDAGSYTMAVVINAEVPFDVSVSLTALHEWVAAQTPQQDDLLSGIADVDYDAATRSVTRVTIPLHRGAFSLPQLSVRFAMPESTLPGFTPARTRSHSSNDNYSVRCVAELYKAGTDKMMLHKVVIPEPQDDGTYLVGLELAEGNYNLCLWADYALTDAPLADAFYHTESLKAVTLFTEPYTANTDAKDTAFGNESGITLPKAGATITLPL